MKPSLNHSLVSAFLPCPHRSLAKIATHSLPLSHAHRSSAVTAHSLPRCRRRRLVQQSIFVNLYIFFLCCVLEVLDLVVFDFIW